MLGETDALGDSEELGETDGLALLLGDSESEGEIPRLILKVTTAPSQLAEVPRPMVAVWPPPFLASMSSMAMPLTVPLATVLARLVKPEPAE